MSAIANAKQVMDEWPTYRKYVENHGIDPDRISKFSDLPIVTKEFLAYALNAIPAHKVRHIIPSSGSTSGITTFGLFGDKDLEMSSWDIDAYLIERFDVMRKRTLILNLLPGGISVNSAVVAIASIGTRIDTAINAVRSFSSSFDQLLLVGEPLFLKQLIEEGLKDSLPWKHMPIMIVVGGEWISESFRIYMESMTGYGRIHSSMGTAELGLNYFHETDETIALRQFILYQKELSRRLFGKTNILPMLFEYDENRVFVEIVGQRRNIGGSVILTTNDMDRLFPLIRYEIGDRGLLLPREKLNHILASMGYQDKINSSGKPILAHFGRNLKPGGISPEKIKEILYSSKKAAFLTTGQFFISNENKNNLLIQLKKDIKPDEKIIQTYESLFSDFAIDLGLSVFDEYPYPLDYERKVKYIDKSNISQ
jgi:phenylacetate-coenzyme A ligase PaaK-like adenylate-forming protein